MQMSGLPIWHSISDIQLLNKNKNKNLEHECMCDNNLLMTRSSTTGSRSFLCTALGHPISSSLPCAVALCLCLSLPFCFSLQLFASKLVDAC